MTRLDWNRTRRAPSEERIGPLPPPAGYKVRARWPGTCLVCEGAIVPGQHVLWNRKRGAQHVKCPARPKP
jgi:hypothetical protein